MVLGRRGLYPATALLLARHAGDGFSTRWYICSSGRDLSHGKNRDRTRIHPCDDCFHAVIRLPAETDPARGMQADAQVVIEAFGKNEDVMRACQAGAHEGSGSGLVLARLWV